MPTSECSVVRHLFEPFLRDRKLVLEMGAGGDVTVEHALPFDMVNPYTAVGQGVKQVFRGHCGDLGFLCDESCDALVSHHLLEDFSYEKLVEIITEWRRVLKVGGLIATNCPNQATFLAHCAATGQGTNDAHYESTFSLETFRSEVLAHTGPWKEVYVEPKNGNYSWLLIVEKV
jgi:hypothetical protein